MRIWYLHYFAMPLTIPRTALAAVFHSPGEPFRLERLPVAELGPGEALVRIRCATICGSDLHTVSGRRRSPVPGILGHEMVGEIVAASEGWVRGYTGDRLEPGARVAWSIIWRWGKRQRTFGHESINSGLFGGYAEYCCLPAGTAVFAVPENLPDLVAAPANCATATASAVLRHAGSPRGAAVVVCGAGMLGLTACAMAREQGAASVIAIEPEHARRTLAASFGADAAIDPADGEDAMRDAVSLATRGEGADIVLELSGEPESHETALHFLKPGGQMILAGAVFPARPVSLPAETIVRRALRLTGVYNYLPADLEYALSFLSETVTRYPFESLVSARFPLEMIDEAFAIAAKNRPLRAAIIPT